MLPPHVRPVSLEETASITSQSQLSYRNARGKHVAKCESKAFKATTGLLFRATIIDLEFAHIDTGSTGNQRTANRLRKIPVATPMNQLKGGHKKSRVLGPCLCHY